MGPARFAIWAGGFRQPRQPLLGGALQQIGIATGIAHQTGGETLAIVDQRLQQMLGDQVLMAAGEGLHLRRLQDTAGAFGQACEVHCGTPSYFPPCTRRGRLPLRGPPHARPFGTGTVNWIGPVQNQEFRPVPDWPASGRDGGL